MGSWTHLELRPAAPAAARVESVWLFDGNLRRRERYFPTGTLDLLIQLDESSPTFRIVDGSSPATCPPSCLAGLLVAPMVVEAGRLTDRLHEPGTDADRLRIVARWVADRLAGQVGVDRSVGYAVAAMERTGGRMRVADIIERVGSTPKRLCDRSSGRWE